MLSKNMIDIDFAATMKQAEEIENIAEDIMNLSNAKMGESLNQMTSYWKSDSATAFFAKAGLVQEQIADTSEKLQLIAQDIKTAAKKMYEAEMKALELAQTRTNG